MGHVKANCDLLDIPSECNCENGRGSFDGDATWNVTHGSL